MKQEDTKNRLAYWFRQWGGPLRKFLRAKRGIAASDLDDVAQEVFLRLLRYDRSELVENPQAYLYKMASNVAAERAIRSHNSRPHDSQWLLALRAAGDGPEQNLQRRQIEAEVQRAINTLAPKQKSILKMHHFEGLGYSEIASRCNASQRSVKRALTKSYEKLRHELDAQLLGEITDGSE